GSIGDISLGTFLRTLCNVADVSGVPAPIMAALDQTGLSGTKAFEIVDTDDAVRDALNNRDVPAVAAAFATAGIAIPADPLQVIITVSTKNSLWYVTDMQSVLYYRLDQSADGEPILGSLEPQLYVVPQTTQLGPTVVQQGYRANATLDL
ncbi:hypothetical protein, partial [Clostridium sardiniense]|uniref:hypothetical protein n=1 Tax=Clostridium sardiniense TaxID=29369 RepID=UPI003D334EBD